MTIGPCTPNVPVAGTVIFVPADFRTLFPEFTSVSDGQLNFNFLRATLLLNNSCCSLVQDANVREVLLNLLVAHITALSNGINGQPPIGLVGRIADTAEGSVNVSAEYSSDVGQSMAYYIQTRYGADYWAATSTFRSARYVAAPCNADGLYGQYGGNPNTVGTPFGPTGTPGCGYNGGSC